MNDLISLGYGPFFSQQLDLEADVGLAPARVVADHGGGLELGGFGAAATAVVPAPLRGQAAVGDWVLCERLPDGTAVLRRVLRRRSALSRQAAGRATGEQVLAVNVDRVLVVHPLDGDEKPRRLERMLVAVRASGAEPAVLLSKADLHPDPEAVRRAVADLAPGLAVLLLSAVTGAGLEAVRALIPPGSTAALLGASGVGKSTLVNALLGAAAAATGALAPDGRGRHVTTHRRLWAVPAGGWLVDGPGLRELQLWGDGGLAPTFADVADLASGCRFADCRHEAEPGCAVQAAVAAGALDAGRLASFQKLRGEAEALAERHGTAARQAERRQGRVLERAIRSFQRTRGR